MPFELNVKATGDLNSNKKEGQKDMHTIISHRQKEELKVSFERIFVRNKNSSNGNSPNVLLKKRGSISGFGADA